MTTQTGTLDLPVTWAGRGGGRGVPGRLLRFARPQPPGAAGAVVILVLIVSAVFSPLVAPDDPLLPAPLDRRAAPSGQHRVGTDDIGRDVFSRVVCGGRVTLKIGILAVFVGTVVGAAIGVMSGYFS